MRLHIQKLVLCTMIISLSVSMVFAVDAINWYSYEDGKAAANETGKPFMIYFYNSRSLPEEKFFDDASVIQAIQNKYTTIKINLDEPGGKDLFDKISKSTFSSCPGQGTVILIQNSKQQFLESRSYCEGGPDNKDFLEFLNKYGYVFQSDDLGNINIMQYNSFVNKSENKYNIVLKAKITGAKVKEINETLMNGQYSLLLDDNTGTMRAFYYDSPDNLKKGDTMDIEIINDGRLSPPKITKTSNIKKAGFVGILASISLFLIVYALKKGKTRE